MPRIQLRNHFEMNYEIVENCMDLDTLFIHGNLASNTWFYPSAEILKSTAGAGAAKHGRMIMAEWRGCGKSSAPSSEAELDMKNLAQDYLDFCEKLAIKKVNVVGHSSGGIIALIAMALKPSLFAKAFLLDPVVATGVQFEQASYDAFTAMSKDRAICEEVMASTIHKVDRSNSLFKKIVNDTFQVSPLSWHGVPHALQDLDVREMLKSISHPIMIVHGEFDPILPIQGSRDLAASLKNAKFVEAKGHGHSLNVEDPKMFVNLLNDFFGEEALKLKGLA